MIGNYGNFLTRQSRFRSSGRGDGEGISIEGSAVEHEGSLRGAFLDEMNSSLSRRAGGLSDGFDLSAEAAGVDESVSAVRGVGDGALTESRRMTWVFANLARLLSRCRGDDEDGRRKESVREEVLQRCLRGRRGQTGNLNVV